MYNIIYKSYLDLFDPTYFPVCFMKDTQRAALNLQMQACYSFETGQKKEKHCNEPYESL